MIDYWMDTSVEVAGNAEALALVDALPGVSRNGARVTLRHAGSEIDLKLPEKVVRRPVIDFNLARSAKGAGPHPGPAPSHRSKGSFAFRRWYAEYLRSADWEKRREHVFERAHGRCEGCGSEEPSQVHHLTYERVGYEMLFDLVAVCPACHSRLHEGRK